jgi:hypothetical protein
MFPKRKRQSGATATTTAARQLLCGRPRFHGGWEHTAMGFGGRTALLRL